MERHGRHSTGRAGRRGAKAKREADEWLMTTAAYCFGTLLLALTSDKIELAENGTISSDPADDPCHHFSGSRDIARTPRARAAGRGRGATSWPMRASLVVGMRDADAYSIN